MRALVTIGLGILLLWIPAGNAVAQGEDFYSPEEASEKIENYMRRVLSRTVVRIHLLEIVESDKDDDLIFVYFMADERPRSYADMNGNIRCKSAPVLMAKFHFSFLRFEWRIKKIKRCKGNTVFSLE